MTSVARVSYAQNVNEMSLTMNTLNTSSETLLYNSSVVEAELDALEERLRLLQTQADEDAQLIHSVSLQQSSFCNRCTFRSHMLPISSVAFGRGARGPRPQRPKSSVHGIFSL